jgi:hypothetical protein
MSLQLDSFAVDKFETSIIFDEVTNQQPCQFLVNVRHFEDRVDNLRSVRASSPETQQIDGFLD